MGFIKNNKKNSHLFIEGSKCCKLHKKSRAVNCNLNNKIELFDNDFIEIINMEEDSSDVLKLVGIDKNRDKITNNVFRLSLKKLGV